MSHSFLCSPCCAFEPCINECFIFGSVSENLPAHSSLPNPELSNLNPLPLLLPPGFFYCLFFFSSLARWESSELPRAHSSPLEVTSLSSEYPLWGAKRIPVRSDLEAKDRSRITTRALWIQDTQTFLQCGETFLPRGEAHRWDWFFIVAANSGDYFLPQPFPLRVHFLRLVSLSEIAIAIVHSYHHYRCHSHSPRFPPPNPQPTSSNSTVIILIPSVSPSPPLLSYDLLSSGSVGEREKSCSTAFPQGTARPCDPLPLSTRVGCRRWWRIDWMISSAIPLTVE